MQLDRGYQRVLVEGAGADNVDVHVNVINVGSGPGPYHFHERCDNVYIVLSGTVEAVVDGVRYTLQKDDVAFIPPGVPHSAGNTGAVEAVVIEIYAPPRGTDFHVVRDPRHVQDANPTGSEGR
jgi:mannose-6-phosphate isomerase-like protein (cupin superfamily)